jgi:hypothetical protein
MTSKYSILIIAIKWKIFPPYLSICERKFHVHVCYYISTAKLHVLELHLIHKSDQFLILSGLFFSQVGEAVLPLILGKNYRVYLQKGKEKLDVNSILGENCTILKNFSLGKQPYYNRSLLK